LAGGILTAAGGRIELGSVAGTSLVSLTPTDFGWTLGYEGVQNFQDIQLSQQAFVDASGKGGGDIQVQGRRVTLTDGSEIGTYTLGSEPGGTLTVTAKESVELIGRSADGQLFGGLFAVTEGTGDGPDLTIATRQLVVRDGAQVFSGTFSEGQGGNLTVTASDFVEVIGTSADGQSPSGLFTQTQGAGAAGKLIVETGQLLARNGAQVSANTFDEGQGGDLVVTASDFVELIGTSADGKFASRLFTRTRGAGTSGDLTIKTGRLLVRDEAQVLTSTFGQGQAGNLTVQNAKEVELVGGTIRNGKFIPSGLFTTAEPNTTGAGGNLTISTEKLIVRDGAQVGATTFGAGNAGNLTVRATDVELVGAALSANGEPLTNEIGLPFTSGLFAGTGIGSGGDGGTLSVETDRLSLQDGANLQTTTFGAGNAGNLIVQAKDSVELTGTAKGSQFPSSLVAVSGGIPGLGGVVEAKGRGGDLTIETGELIVQDGAAVAVSSLNPASVALGAGNLQITAQSIRLHNLAKLQAETASGDGGNIKLLVQDLLLLRRNSEISTTAGIASTGGNGGNIAIDTPFMIAVPDEDSDITANAFEGAGGLIQIKATQVFGLERREQLTPLSDITAFSQQNPELNGIVEINTPDVDPSRGLVSLPAEVVDASELIASGCGTPGTQEQSEFIVMGRGGLPSSPSDTFSSDTVWTDLRSQTQQAQTLPISELATQQTLPNADQVVEAQGWVINNKGEVVLTASAPTVTPHSPGLTPGSCHG
jgi:large exoprotein involved in heme utilization and adhesion